MPNLKLLKELIFKNYNNACFTEKERILCNPGKKYDANTCKDKYAVIAADCCAEQNRILTEE